MHQEAPIPMEPELDCIRLRSVGCRKYKKRRDFRQGAKRGLLKERPGSERFQDDNEHDQDHDHSRYLIDNPVESLGMPIVIRGEILHPAGE
jgi:hypothetical protein